MSAEGAICVWETMTPETHHDQNYFGTLARTRYATKIVVWARAEGSGGRDSYPAPDLLIDR